MATLSLKRKKNNNLKNQKRTRLSGDSAIIKPLSAKQTGKRAAEGLKEIENRFRLAFENANIGMCLVDFQGRLTKVNHQMCEIFGYSQEELEGMTVNDIAHPEDMNISPSFIQMATSGEIEHTKFEKRYFHKDGHIVWGQVSSSLVRDTQGKPKYFISHVQDITDRKRAEEALWQEGLFRTSIIEHVAEGLCVCHEITEFPYVAFTIWNERMTKITGYSIDEINRLGWYQTMYPDPEVQVRAIERMARMRQGDDIMGEEWEITRADGEKRVLSISTSVLQTGDGIVHVLALMHDITEQKQAEEALRQSEEKYRTILENIADGYYEVDIAGNLTFFNDSVSQLLGYTKEELKGKNNREYMDQENAEKLYQTFNRVFKTGSPSKGFGWEIIRKDGTKRHIEASISLVRDRAGQPIGFRGIVRDITERKQAEQNLKESEEKYRLLVEESRQGIVIAQGIPPHMVFVNPAMTMILGYSFEELSSLSPKEIEDLVHPEDRAFFFKNYKDRLEGKLVLPRYEIRGIRKDGSLVWLELSSTRIEYKGQPAVQATFLDITERKQSEETLRQSEERYRTILENIEDGYYEVDLPGNFTFFNESLCRMLGYSRDEMIGMGNQQYTDEENRKKLFQAFNKVYRTGEPTKEFGWEVFRKDGTKLFSEVSVSLIKDLKGQPIGFRGIARDITKRKQAEEALRSEKQRFQTLSEQAPFGMVMIDKDGTFRYINPKFRELFGYDLIDIPDGKTWSRKAYPVPSYRHVVIETWKNDLESSRPGEKRSRIFTVTCKDGTEKTINFIPVQLATGENLMACEDITERKQAEEALEESEEKFRAMTATAADAIIMMDNQGCVNYWNPAAEIMFGYTPQEAMGKDLHLFLAPKTYHEAYQKGFEKFRSTGQGIAINNTIEFVAIKKGGAEFPIEVSTSAIKLKDQWHAVGIVRDITERKRSEESLEKSEMKFMELFNDAPVGYFEYNVDGLITSVNRTYLEMLRYKFEEMIGKPVWKFIVENEVARQQILGKLAGIRPPARGIERTYRRKDGTTLPVLVEDRVLRDSAGKITGIRATIQDITERKHAEAALRESEAKYRQLVEYAPSGIFEIDLNTLKFLNVNDVMCEVMGYSKEQLFSMSPIELLTEESRNLLAERMKETRPGEKIPDSTEYKLRKKDKSEFWALVNTKMFYKDGKPFKAQVVAQDISERKRLEEQLIQSQKMEAVGQLAGGIAHDFNNLLTVIKGYGQLSLLDLKESDPLWGNIQEIQKATQRASDLTRQLLAFSRRQILDPKVLNLNSLVKDLNKMLHRIIGEDIELITLLEEDLGGVKVDPGQIEQMILNLAVNARDAMPSGGKLIIETKNVEIDAEYVATHIGLATGRYVRLSVSDTGLGMSQEIIEKAFEPFFTTKEMGKGTGLGLSTVYGIVKQSGGNIWVYSEPGYGTTFNIYLPRVEENLDALGSREESDFLPKGSETVLLVEDESSVRNLAYRILCQQGYTVLEAANGDEALCIVQEPIGKKIDLLLTDVVMPKMSGKELADRIKTLRPELKVLFTSGYTNDAIVHHGVLAPGTHFLQKPFSFKSLSCKVREVLDQ
jgi:PAS domain S-box-containing protein